MEKRSWFFQNSLFYSILALVLLIHILLMVMRLVKFDHVADNEPTSSRSGPPIKLKMLSGPSARPMVKRQIVQSQDPQKLSKPNDSTYLSDKDRTFDRQTLAKKIDRFNSAGKGTGATDVKEISLGDLGAFDKTHNAFAEGAKMLAQSKSQKASTAGVENGDATQKGVSSTNDFVEGVPLGDLTYLNTTEYKYYGFFHRIRQKLEQFWGRSIQEKAALLEKNGRRVANEDNLITALVVTLNAEGEIVKIAVKGTSGIKELDEAAVDSFNQAGPFPNPPKGLMENGLVKVEWGFVVKTSSL